MAVVNFPLFWFWFSAMLIQHFTENNDFYNKLEISKSEDISEREPELKDLDKQLAVSYSYF